ncbi:fumarylacetoacetate hydrolase family protein [Methanosphaera sp.]
MKYIKYKTSDNEIHVGIVEDDVIYCLEYTCIIEAIRNEDSFRNNYSTNEIVNLDDVTLLPPTTPSKVICVGLNYKDHADELDMTLPTEPLLFMKPSTSIVATNQPIIYPENTSKLDFEGELGIVILDKIGSGDFNKNIHLGYTIINDVTARDLQEKDGQWTRSKSFDTFCPCGPVVVTNIDSSNLNIKSEVNGNIKQNSNTKNMIFSPLTLVEYISNIMTLNPGDLIATGTPPGIDHLQKNDVITITIDEIGKLENIVK